MFSSSCYSPTCTHCLCSIGRYTRDLPLNIVDSLIESAFSIWARASSLTFVRLYTRRADIMVDFVTSGKFFLFVSIRKRIYLEDDRLSVHRCTKTENKNTFQGSTYMFYVKQNPVDVHMRSFSCNLTKATSSHTGC